MKIGDKTKIYSRLYDGKKWGEGEPNQFLGEYKITKVIMEDFYAGKWLAQKDGKEYMIIQTEVSGMSNPGNGGSRFEAIQL
jgi:hypothetical protein